MKTEPRSLGPRRDLIVFQRRFRKSQPSATGRAQEEWQDIGPQCRCDLKPVRGGDAVMAGRVSGVTSYRVWVRYHRDLVSLKATDRAIDVKQPARQFMVQSALVNPERDWIDVVLQVGGPT